LPAEADPLFVARMEDILDVYARPVDPARPVVCFDEAGKELRAARRRTVPPAPGQPPRQDHEYVRAGSASLLLWTAPHLGRRHVTVTDQRTRVEFAEALRELVDIHFPLAERIVLVLDNLNTHSPAALYHTFPPADAKRIWDKLELHYTPVHASWLNVAECELSVLARHCLDRRIPDRATLITEVAAWEAERNTRQVGVDWHFTTPDARRKLMRLYPVPVYAN
jgi:hypothetical protein